MFSYTLTVSAEENTEEVGDIYFEPENMQYRKTYLKRKRREKKINKIYRQSPIF